MVHQVDSLLMSVLSIIGSAITSIIFCVYVYVLRRWEVKAALGDKVAQEKIILPCYKEFAKQLRTLYCVLACFQSWVFYFPDVNDDERYITLQYYSFILLIIYTIVPLIFLQPSVTITAFHQTAKIILPWWLVCTIVWAVSLVTEYYKLFRVAFAMQMVFSVTSVAPALLLGLGIRFKYLKTRIDIANIRFRASKPI